VSSLKFLDLSNNLLSGVFHTDIDTIFPSLQVVIASYNCFAPSIPLSFCNLHNISTLIMNKMGSECKSTDVSICLNTFRTRISSPYHSIPPCLFQLTSLQTLHLIGNYLNGKLSEVTPSLVSLSLVGNLLVGSVPKSIQLSSTLTDLQLSLNRLEGTLHNFAFENLPLNSTTQLYSNRLSGNIPKSMDSFKKNNADILTGDLFYYVDSPPSNMKNYKTYSCGSNSINFYETFYT